VQSQKIGVAGWSIVKLPQGTGEGDCWSRFNVLLSEGDCPAIALLRLALVLTEHANVHAYNDGTIHCYMCFLCAEKHLHIAGWDRYGEPSQYKGGIEYQKVDKVMHVIGDNDAKWDENFDFDVWLERYGPRSSRDTQTVSGATNGKTLKEPDHGYVEGSWEWKRSVNCVRYEDAMKEKNALCCPEDVRQDPKKCTHSKNALCKYCEIPVCLECWSRLQARSGFRIPAALTNDNFQGFAHAFIVLNKVRWIEAVTACPFFTCLVTYYVEGTTSATRSSAVRNAPSGSEAMFTRTRCRGIQS
jgi:hypothetical protein